MGVKLKPLTWAKCENDESCPLNIQWLDKSPLRERYCLCVIWHNGTGHHAIKIAAGILADVIKIALRDIHIQSFKKSKLYIEYAPIEEHLADGCIAYLAMPLKPIIPVPIKRVVLIPCNPPNGWANKRVE